VISTEEHHGFVDNCIALIERLLDDGTIAAVIPHRVTPTAE
jgi:hypothetical protein